MSLISLEGPGLTLLITVERKGPRVLRRYGFEKAIWAFRFKQSERDDVTV